MNDGVIKQNIIDELEFEPSIDASGIGVAVRSGIVTLTGAVGSYAQKVVAQQAAMRVKGVKGIAEDIVVRPEGHGSINDEQIAERAVNALKWSTLVPDGRVIVEVENGKVALSGSLDWAYQKRGALDVVRALKGVTDIEDNIELKARLNTGDIRTAIERALQRNAGLDGHVVEITVDGNEVTLTGRVGSFAARQVVEDAAWSVPSVTRVVDHLTVG
jgi:osmotically-inducible protein OsmY